MVDVPAASRRAVVRAAADAVHLLAVHAEDLHEATEHEELDGFLDEYEEENAGGEERNASERPAVSIVRGDGAC